MVTSTYHSWWHPLQSKQYITTCYFEGRHGYYVAIVQNLALVHKLRKLTQNWECGKGRRGGVLGKIQRESLGQRSPGSHRLAAAGKSKEWGKRTLGQGNGLIDWMQDARERQEPRMTLSFRPTR